MSMRRAYSSNVRDAFSAYATNDSMSPRIAQGDLLLIHPHKPVRPGRDVLIVLSSDGAEHRMLVKRFVRRTPEALVVEQFNPPMQFEIPSGEILQLMSVAGIFTE